MMCDDFAEQTSAFVDGELSEQHAGALFGHLAACPSCREQLQHFVRLRILLARSATMDEQAGPGKESRREPDRPPSLARSSRNRRSIGRTLVLPAAILLACIAGMLSVRLSPREDSTGNASGLYVISEPVEVHGYYSSYERR